MHKILVIRLYFLLDALHVPDYVSPSSGATFISSTSHIPVYADTIRVTVVCLQPHNIHTYVTVIYQMRCTPYKVAPEDGLIQSETCREYERNM
jgi:hypothetical protein